MPEQDDKGVTDLCQAYPRASPVVTRLTRERDIVRPITCTSNSHRGINGVKRNLRVASGLVIALVPVVGWSDDGLGATPDTTARIQAAINKLAGQQVPIEGLKSTSVSGLYQVEVAGRFIYVTDNGRFALTGDLIDLETGENYTQSAETARQAQLDTKRRTLLAELKLDQEDAITFAPDGEPKYTVTVFTDVDCAYCRKLHALMPEYNRRGIAIRYLASPRAGLESPAYNTMVSVWCADDRRQALTDAKAGKTISAKRCDNPVARHLDLALKLELSGTPMLILPDGRLVPGFVEPDELIRTLASSETPAGSVAQAGSVAK